jgi:tRNA threonylcarbamoyl adenosine modification protein YjeE
MENLNINKILNREGKASEFKEIMYSFEKNKNGATIILLRGDLGAGKTAFVKEVAKIFEIGEEITSPTFVIEKKYKIKGNSFFKNLIHIDAYRLTSGLIYISAVFCWIAIIEP